MEYRVWTTVPRLPVEGEARWQPFIELLEREHGDLGPILSWEADRSAVVVMALDAESPAAAAGHVTGILAAALRGLRLGDRDPTVMEVEPVADRAAGLSA